jgi:4-amino-4-deoxy-L-arabinose transferase-like glycosyltransferase
MAVYLATNIFLDGELEDYILAGLFSGFAASTKYNGALVIVSILLAHVLYNKNPLKKFFNLLLAGFFSITGFIIGTPYAVLDYKTFLRTDGPAGALWQFTNVGSRGLIDRITNTINIILFKISDDVAYIVLIGFFIVLGYLLFKFFSRQYVKDAYFRSLGFLVFPALFFIFYIGGLEKSRSHYLLVVYPYLSVVFGYLIFKLSEFSEQKSGILTYLLIPIFLAPVFYFAVMTSYAFYNGDTRVDFYKWAKANFNSPFPVVYSDRSAEVVVNSFARNRYRAKNIELIAPEGYLYSQDESFPEEEVRTRARVVNLLYDSGDSVQNGPKIKFYSYSL